MEWQFRVTTEFKLAGIAFPEAVLPADVHPACDETTESWGALVQHRPESVAWILEYYNLPSLFLRPWNDR
jgi:hypothetical protein